MRTLKIAGNPFEVGRQLGEFGRFAYHEKVRKTALWQRIQALSNSTQAKQLCVATQVHQPDIWMELNGLAQGLDAPLGEVFAWNCRGDLVESTSDGCTTVYGHDADGARIIAHNEDGFPQLYDDCALVEVTQQEALAFTSFAYPGSLCGHTFAVNAAGIVNTVNNIRASQRPLGLPRQVLARAALNASTLDDALTILTQSERAGSFHHTLAQVGLGAIYSVEATGAHEPQVRVIHHTGGHANHLIYADTVAQKITTSSRARQQRVDEWLKARGTATLSVGEALAILSDTQNAVLPIYRQSPNDPDDENTLATMVYRLSADEVSWSLWRRDRQTPVLQGTTRVSVAV